MGASSARTRDLTGRGIATGAALLALAVGGLTMTDRALGAAPAAPPICIAGVANGSEAPNIAIPDNPATPLSRTLVVSGAPTVLLDVDVRTTIAHPFSGDLAIELISPQGTTVLLKGATRDFVDPDGPGIVGPKANVFTDTLWDDSAATPATDKVFADNTPSGALIPEHALGAFIGEDPNGSWTLRVRDTDVGAAGTLQSWSLDITAIDREPELTTLQTPGTSPLAIPDGGSYVSRDITVSGAKAYLWDVNLETFVSHPEREDLDITLTHLPSGRSTVISTDNRGLPTVATFDDSSPVGVGSFIDPPAGGNVAPEGAMAAFVGIDPNGTWRVSVRDDFDDTPDSGGVLNSAKLTIASTDGCATPPATPPVTPPVVTPPVALPPATPPAVAATRLTPRKLGLALSTRRDRVAPYRFAVRGTLVRPVGSKICAGRVAVSLKAGKKTVITRTVALRRSGANCTYRAAFSLKKKPATLPKSGALTVSARFLGTTRLKPRVAKATTVRLG